MAILGTYVTANLGGKPTALRGRVLAGRPRTQNPVAVGPEIRQQLVADDSFEAAGGEGCENAENEGPATAGARYMELVGRPLAELGRFARPVALASNPMWSRADRNLTGR